MALGTGQTNSSSFIRLGVRPDGSVMSPVMPYPAFSKMSDEDVTDLAAYLRTLPSVARANQAHELSVPFAELWHAVWRWLFFSAEQAPSRRLRLGLREDAT